MLTGVVRRLTAEQLAREPRSLGVIAYFAGYDYGSNGRVSRLEFPREITPGEERDWREGFAEGRRERVCHSWHGFTPHEHADDHPPTPREENDR